MGPLLSKKGNLKKKLLLEAHITVLLVLIITIFPIYYHKRLIPIIAGVFLICFGLVSRAAIRRAGTILNLEKNLDHSIQTQLQLERRLKFEELFFNTFEQAAVGIVHANPEGRFIRVNKKFCEIVGYEYEEILKMSFKDITYPDDLQSDLQLLQKLISGQIDNFSLEKRYIKKDKSLVWVELTVSVIKEICGTIDYFIGVIEDISERKNIEQEILRQNRSILAELQLAASIQRKLLPVRFPKYPMVNFSWEMYPSNYVGGDMFNVFQLDEDNIGIYILDVKGHGVSAALKAIAVSYLMKPSARPKSYIDGKNVGNRIFRPSETLLHLNERLMSESGKNFFTMFYGILNLSTLELTYSIAGHNPPIIFSEQSYPQVLDKGGPAVGLIPNHSFVDKTLKLKGGDKVFLHTDGIIEAEDLSNNRFGLEKLLDVIYINRTKSVAELTTIVGDEVMLYLGGRALCDDMAILAFEITS